jgi:hypothetical protein
MNGTGPSEPQAIEEGARPGLWREVALPREHGAWSFVVEPIVLGLVVAFSLGGLFLAIAALAAFLARRPLRLLASDWILTKRYPRTAIAERALWICALAGVFALGAALGWSLRPVQITLGIGLPFAIVALVFDMSGRPRHLIAECAGALAFAPLATGIALAKSWDLGPALGLAGVMALRSVPSILYVRARLRLEKRRPAAIVAALFAQLVAIALAFALAWFSLAPSLAAGAIVVLGARAAFGVSALRPVMSTKQLGFSEIAFGVMTIALTTIGVMRGL